MIPIKRVYSSQAILLAGFIVAAKAGLLVGGGLGGGLGAGLGGGLLGGLGGGLGSGLAIGGIGYGGYGGYGVGRQGIGLYVSVIQHSIKMISIVFS